MLVWLIHNLSLNYSDIVQSKIQAECNIDGFSESSEAPAEIAVRCDMPGFRMIYLKRSSHTAKSIRIAADDMHFKEDELFYMTASDLTKYFHEIFGENARLEYFVTDTVFFRFTRMNFKKVPVNAVSNITFKAQYMSKGDLEIQPDSVLVYGSLDRLSAISRVNTRQIVLHNISSDEYGSVLLEHPSGLRISHEKVDYSIQTVRYTENTVTLPVIMDDVPQGLDIHVIPSKAQVRVRTVFPSDYSFENAYVRISYNDFADSVSGKCTGELSGTSSEVLHWEITPEVFECLIQ